ncbi:MAG: hypothetical protein ABH871_08760 [Pseudomonadota bacterium]
MIELLLTMALLSVIGMLFISYTGDVGNVAVDAASYKIQSDIRYAQQLATSTGTPHGIQFIKNGNYTVYRDTLENPISDPLDKQPMIKDMEGFGDVAINITLNVKFDKAGKPIEGGGQSVEIVSPSGAARRIYIIDNTGSVVVDVLGYSDSCSCRVCIQE